MEEIFNLETLGQFLGVLLIDLILSGDNAVVIALAVRSLQGSVRRKAIYYGVAGAIGLRLLFVTIVSYLLGVPFLQLVGGVLLIWIAWRLVHEEPEDKDIEAGTGLWSAIRIIIIADVVMSLDNVIALVGVSGGKVWLVAFGIALTIPLIIYGSTILSTMMNRFPWLVYAGSGLLVWVAIEMMLHDEVASGIAESLEGFDTVLRGIITAVFIGVAYLYARQTQAAGK